jgi:alpha 1,6-mannosyltransferase
MDSLQSEGEKEEDDDDDDRDEMFNLNGVRATLLGAISKVSLADPSQWRLISIPMEYLRGFELSRWHPQHTPPRFLRLLLGFFTLLVCLVFWSHSTPTSYTPAFPTPNMEILNFTTSNRLPLIPPKIWQIYLSYSPGALAGYQFPMHSWISKSPSHSYTVLDGQGALAIVSKLSQDPKHAHILPTFYAMSRRVLRADFLRYLMLAIEGGVYSDIDTELLKPIHEWVPDEYKLKTRLVVGLEADQSPPVAGTTYEVQFCQWTLAGAADHPALWMMVDQILEKVKKRPFHDPPKDIDYSDDEVLDITGPAGWTETVFEYLNLPENRVGEEMVTWRNLTGMKKPKLYGDVLILPINGFATGVPHSGAAEGVVDDTFVKHQFAGAWRGGDH